MRDIIKVNIDYFLLMSINCTMLNLYEFLWKIVLFFKNHWRNVTIDKFIKLKQLCHYNRIAISSDKLAMFFHFFIYF